MILPGGPIFKRLSGDKHGVAEGEEAVALPHGLGVGVQDVLAPGKGADQHDQGALRQVEVGHQGVHALEPVSRVDEDVRPAALRVHCAVGVGEALQSAAGRRADADHAAACGLGLVDNAGRLLGDYAELGVHVVVLYLVLLDGAEGAQADVQRDEALAHALGGDAVQQFPREVQSCRGGGGGAELAGEHAI